MNNERELLIAYAAGLIDSDGSISIVRSFTIRNNTHWPRFELRVQAAQTSLEGLSVLTALAGGQPYNLSQEAYLRALDSQRNHGYKVNPARRRPIWRWYVGARKAETFLRLLLPHLRVKRRQALIALEFRELQARQYKEWLHWPRVNVDGTFREYPAEFKAAQAACVERLRALNDFREHQPILGI